MPDGHHRQQLRLRQPGQIRADRQRRLGLAEEERGGDVQRLGAAGPHQPGHHDREAADDPLHHAQVIEHGEQGRDEDDRRQDPEGEDETGRALGVDQRLAEDELGAGQGAVEDRLDRLAGALSMARIPAGTRRTRSAKPHCRTSPQKTTRPEIARRFSERKTATPRIATIPTSPRARSAMSNRSIDSGTEIVGRPGPQRDPVLAADLARA